jgi:RHS repeat-associated protein
LGRNEGVKKVRATRTRTSCSSPLTCLYDARGRLASLTNPFLETSGWTYDVLDRLATQSQANGVTSTYSFNALGQLTSLVNQLGGTTLSQFDNLLRNGAGDLLGVTTSVPSVPAYSGALTLGYDPKGQLLQEQSTRLGAYTHAFGYDSAGNATTFKGLPRTFNLKNQLQGTGFVYDSEGNPTTYAGSALTFDPENRATSFGTALSAGYRADGLRAWKETPTGRVYFLYLGGSPVAEFDGTGALRALNTWGANGLVSRRTSSGSVFYTFDNRGGTVQRLDSLGNVLSTHAQDAFGVNTSTTPTSDPYDGFGGQFGYYRDPETGLLLLTHRYYDPTTGRFVTRDPSGYDGGVNLYGFTGSSPWCAYDPGGNSGKPLWYDDLRTAWSGWAETAKKFYNNFYAEKPLGWVAAGTINTGIDLVSSYAYMPATIGHLGEGLGSWAGDPGSRENQLAAWDDIGTICSIGLAFSGSANPAAKGTRATTKLADPPAFPACRAAKTLSRAERMAANRGSGLAVQNTVAEELMQSGAIVKQNVYFRTPSFGPRSGRFIDIVVYNMEGMLLRLVEVKSGGSRYGGKQLAKDIVISSELGIPVELHRR